MLHLEDQRDPPRRGRWKRAGVAALSLAAGGAGFWLAVTVNAAPPPEPAAEAAAGYQMLTLDEIYVNLRSRAAIDSPADRLMRIRLSVLYDPARMPAATGTGALTESGRTLDKRRLISAEAPLIQDLFVGYLRQLDETELAGSFGMETLKTELLRRARLAVGHDGPEDVLIGELVIQ